MQPKRVCLLILPRVGCTPRFLFSTQHNLLAFPRGFAKGSMCALASLHCPSLCLWLFCGAWCPLWALQTQSRGQILVLPGGFFRACKKDTQEEGLTMGCSVECTCGIFWIPQLCWWLLVSSWKRLRATPGRAINQLNWNWHWCNQGAQTRVWARSQLFPKEWYKFFEGTKNSKAASVVENVPGKQLGSSDHGKAEEDNQRNKYKIGSVWGLDFGRPSRANCKCGVRANPTVICWPWFPFSLGATKRFC